MWNCVALIADGGCISNCLWDLRTILAIHPFVHICCSRSHANYYDWSFWIEVKAWGGSCYFTTSRFHVAVQWILQTPFSSFFLPKYHPGAFYFRHKWLKNFLLSAFSFSAVWCELAVYLDSWLKLKYTELKSFSDVMNFIDWN